MSLLRRLHGQFAEFDPFFTAKTEFYRTTTRIRSKRGRNFDGFF